MGSYLIQKVCLIKVPSETLKNLRGGSYRPPKISKKWTLIGAASQHKKNYALLYESSRRPESCFFGPIYYSYFSWLTYARSHQQLY